jgi:hypothetical protein
MIQKIENYIVENQKKKSFYWGLTLITFFIILFFSFPPFYSSSEGSSWNALFRQINNPFQNSNSNQFSHDSKLTFRLLPVFIGKIMFLNKTSFVIFQYFIGILSIRVLLDIFNEKLKNLYFAFLLTLSYGFIYCGKVSFIELRGIFDGLALFFILITFYKSNKYLIFSCILLSSWTDERGLIASSFVFLHYLIIYFNDKKNSTRAILISIIFSWISYFAIRFLITYIFDLKTNTGGINTKTLALNFELFPISLYGALEGFWLFFLINFFQSKYKFSFVNLLLLLCMFIVLLVSYFVYDVTRSLAYLFPSVFILLSSISKYKQEQIRNIVFCVFILSFLFPAYYIGGGGLNWTKPLLFDLIFQFFTNS